MLVDEKIFLKRNENVENQGEKEEEYIFFYVFSFSGEFELLAMGRGWQVKKQQQNFLLLYCQS